MNPKSIVAVLKKKLLVIICIVLIFLVGGLGFLGVFENVDNRIYDFLLRFTPEPSVAEEVVFIDIEDLSLEVVGTWPWTRDILADCLIRMRELGAKSTTFDIEYLSPSQGGIDPDALADIPQKFDESQGLVMSVMEELAAATAAGQFAPGDLPEISGGVLESDILPSLEELRSSVNNLFRDNDDYFGRAIQFFGNAWLTVNYNNVMAATEEDVNYVKQRMLMDAVDDTGDLIYKSNRKTIADQNMAEGFSPAISKIMRRAAGAGFTNVIVDPDGLRRRVELLFKSDDKYLGQLVFAPMMDMLQVESIQRNSRSLVLKNALLPGSAERQDITIPLDRNGYMLINWLHKNYASSFVHIPVLSLLYLDDYEEQIISCLRWFYEDCYLLGADGSWLEYYEWSYYLLEEYAQLKATKEALLAACEGFDVEGNPIGQPFGDAAYEAYFAGRQDFFALCEEFLQGESLNQIKARLEELAQEGVDAEEIEGFLSAVEETYGFFQETLTAYQESFTELQAHLQGAFCIIGNSATGTTDMGATPFVARYANVGTHGNVYNTIVSQEFIQSVNWEWVYFPVSLLTFLMMIVFIGKKQRYQLVGGFIGVMIIPVVALLSMHFGRIYIPITATFLVVFITYILDVVFRFIYAENDKRFLRQAFSTYLSKDIVDDLVNHPEALALGGSEKNVTALFSDIKSFSTLSEQLTAPQLVAVLNEYLTSMSDVILDYSGTIDKYIGDAIVSFFGAPMDVPDHAFKACASAVRMKQIEKKLNETRVADGTLPMPIYTRIGINTGKMVIGNMGTDKKMNYTMMGNHVNIAARLEGVNKVYASWILVSESTWEEANSGQHEGELVARRLDQVRVMGINKPVQLYNIMGFTAEMTEDEKKSVEVFHQGLDLYLGREFLRAIELFQEAGRLNPEDKAPNVFIERCQKFIKEPPAPDWSGIMTMSTK